MATKKVLFEVGTIGSGKAQNEFNKLGKSVASTALKYISLTAAYYGVIRGIGSIVEKYKIQEAAERRLEVAYGRRSQALLDQAAALQKSTTFADEEIIQAQALIASFVKEEDAVKRATEATLDLAAAKGMDLKAAADLVAKSLGSSTNALSRYGIQVEGAVGSQERLNSLTQNIAKVFGGQASAQADTLAGKIENLSNSFGDLLEKFGKVVAIGDEQLGVLGGLARAFDWIGEQINPLLKMYDFMKIRQEAFNRVYGDGSKKIKEQGKELQKVSTEWDKYVKKQNEARAEAMQTADFAARYNILLAQQGEFTKEINVSNSELIHNYRELGQEVALISEVYESVGDKYVDMVTKELDTTQRFADMFSSTFRSTFIESFNRGSLSLKRFGQVFVETIENMASTLLANAGIFGLFNLFGIPGAGGLFGGGSLLGLLGFQHGGSFKVRGSGGPDSQVVAFRATPGEEVNINPPGQSNKVIINFINPIMSQDFVSDQIIPQIKTAIRRGEA